MRSPIAVFGDSRGIVSLSRAPVDRIRRTLALAVSSRSVVDLVLDRIRGTVGGSPESNGSTPRGSVGGLERLPDAALEIDEAETVRAANQHAREIVGIREDPLVGRGLDELVSQGALPPDFLQRYRDAVEPLLAGDVDTVRVGFTRDESGGARRYVANCARRGGGGIIATIREVTERHRRRDQLERYETLLQIMPDTVVVSDEEGRVIDLHGFEGWSGYTREELLGTDMSKTIPEEHRERVWEVAYELAEDDEREKATVEIEIETKDGERIPFENHLTLLPPDDDGQIPGSMSVLRDVRDRKTHERQLSAMNESMRELITAESPQEMAELVVETACDVLGFDVAAFALSDEDAASLEYVAMDPDRTTLAGERTDAHSGLSREAFETGERRSAEFADHPDGEDGDTVVQHRTAYPLGEYGVLELGANAAAPPADRTSSLAAILAGNVEAALDRVFYREERAMLEERERELDLYERAVEATTDGIAVLNEDVEFLMVNSRFAESVGQTKEELVGTSAIADPSDVIVEQPDDVPERWIETSQQARETGRSEFFFESTVELPHGLREIENRVTAVEQDDGDLIHVVTTRDISERIEREQRIEQLHESTRDLMAADSHARVAEEVVDAVESILGFPANVVRLIDDEGEALEPVAVTDQARDLLGERSPVPIEGSAVGDAYQCGDALLVDDYREHDDTDEEPAFRSLLSLPIGEYGLLSIVDDEVGAYDESDRRIAEILTSNAEAAFARVEREEALRERERALSRQIDRLDQFANVLSHDLRNPLNVAQGNLSLLAQQVDERERVDTIATALDRMEAIIEDVLTLAREGDEATDCSPIGLRSTVERCWSNVDTAAATLEVETGQTILADESRLQQLLENLIRNGIDHVGEEVTIRVGSLEDGFYVEDDGPGIPPDDRDRIFETGFSTGEEGTGFGLSIVRTIAEAHDWTVAVTDGSDGGARFEITGVEGD